MSATVKTLEEIKLLRQGGHILATVLRQVTKQVKPGVSTAYLNDLAEHLLRRQGAEPSFLNYGQDSGNPFPATLCTSVDNVVVHGIPSPQTILRAGQLIGLDIGCWYKGLCTDMAVTVAVGQVSEQVQRLIYVTKKSLQLGLQVIKNGARTGDIGWAVQTYVEEQGFQVVRQMVGHGVGYAVHEDPPIPNFGLKNSGTKLKTGMVIAVEPMVNQGSFDIKILPDGWTVVTQDGGLSAHFEVTVVVTEKGYEVLTA